MESKPADKILYLAGLSLAIFFLLISICMTLFSTDVMLEGGNGGGVVATSTPVVQPQQVQPPPVQPQTGSATCQTISGPVNVGATIPEGKRSLQCVGQDRWEYVNP